MATRAQALIPITIAAAIVGIVGLAAVPDDVKLESVDFPRGTIALDGKFLEVQIADDNPRRVRGLMFQEGLEYDEGMIFKFENEGVHSLWMLNMQFPLDMIWFDSDGRVVHIEENVQPCKTALETRSCTESTDSSFTSVQFQLLPQLLLLELTPALLLPCDFNKKLRVEYDIFSTRIYIMELTLCTPSSALFVPSVTSDKDPPLLLSRYLPARIIGAPIAHVTPVGSGIHIMIKPTFCMCFPVFGERFNEDIPETLLPAVSAISLYMLARLLTEAECAFIIANVFAIFSLMQTSITKYS